MYVIEENDRRFKLEKLTSFSSGGCSVIVGSDDESVRFEISGIDRSGIPSGVKELPQVEVNKIVRIAQNAIDAMALTITDINLKIAEGEI